MALKKIYLKETTEKNISIVLEKLVIMSNGGAHCKTPTTIFSHFESKIRAAIDEIRGKDRYHDIDAIYEHIKKQEASNADKNLIETVIAEFTNQNAIINKKTCHGLT